MSNLLKLPAKYEYVNPNHMLPAEGEHACAVVSISSSDDTGVKATFRIAEGADKGLTIEQTYHLDHVLGLRLFKQLMEAIGMRPEKGHIDLDEAADKELIIAIAHRTRNGATYANIVRHEPIPDKAAE